MGITGTRWNGPRFFGPSRPVSHLSELRHSRLLWGCRHQDPASALKDTNLTQFAPDVIAGLYLPLFTSVLAR